MVVTTIGRRQRREESPVQQFKSVYFPDHSAPDAKRRNVKIAFGAEDADLFDSIRALSSEDVRTILGTSSLEALKAEAEVEGTSLNAYCVTKLRQHSTKALDNQLRLIPEPAPSVHPLVDPLQATFRGGVEEPLHEWYPYLEGYSPEFVDTVLDTFASNANRVLDPFAGAGTTPLTAARRGCTSFYCELNPLLQFLIETKATAATAPKRQRSNVAAHLIELAAALPDSLARCEADLRLRIAYENTFGDSDFFPAATFDSVLRLRTWLDELVCTDPLAAAIASVAVTAVLIPCSNLIRRGDLRFRKGSELSAVRSDLVRAVGERLRGMADDLIRLDTESCRPLLIAGDAKRLDRIAPLGVDAIVTSPPYLNGTNYYRNTKVELWFLRSLLSGRDLAALRRQTVTAGINDVTVEKAASSLGESVEELVLKLQASAYDRRIPQMVASYFADMGQVFRGLLHHVEPGARLLIDIGDSAYAGVHVDTPSILSKLLRADGWLVDQEVTLRQRMSRSGQPLRQVLLAATSPRCRTAPPPQSPKWRLKWCAFKKELFHQQGDFAKRKLG